MSQVEAPDPASSPAIFYALRRVERADLLALLSATDALAANVPDAVPVTLLHQHLGDARYPIGFKAVVSTLLRLRRSLSIRGGVLDRLALTRDIARVRANLQHALVDSYADPAPTTLAEPAAPSPVDTKSLDLGIIKVYEMCVGRTPVAEEIEIWKGHLRSGLPFHEFLLLMSASPEAQRYAKEKKLLPDLTEPEFIQAVYEILHGRGCAAWEIQHWSERLASGASSRVEMLRANFVNAAKRLESPDSEKHDVESCAIMGTSRTITLEDWRAQARKLESDDAAQPERESRYVNRFFIKSEPKVLVTAIASVYRGGEFIEQFMENIASQTCFRDYCELIVVDADSPDNESAVIERYLRDYANIRYMRMNFCIGIYDAWTLAAKVARGDYVTNTNLDDLRRKDSLELQAATLDNLPFVDVVYQDVFYTFDPYLPFERIAEFGYESDMPLVTAHTMMRFNAPHNAPMWRRRLHDELGYFDGRFKSAGDYEFWMRCVQAGKVFYKLNDTHVIYYQNPKGISTRPDSRGVLEAREIMKMYGRRLVSENLLMPFEDFRRSRLYRYEARPGETGDRYACAQGALRNAARALKWRSAHNRGLDDKAAG